MQYKSNCLATAIHTVEQSQRGWMAAACHYLRGARPPLQRLLQTTVTEAWVVARQEESASTRSALQSCVLSPAIRVVRAVRQTHAGTLSFGPATSLSPRAPQSPRSDTTDIAARLQSSGAPTDDITGRALPGLTTAGSVRGADEPPEKGNTGSLCVPVAGCARVHSIMPQVRAERLPTALPRKAITYSVRLLSLTATGGPETSLHARHASVRRSPAPRAAFH
jgi:hypothetical protein